MKFTLGFMLHTLPIQRVAEYAKKLASNFSEASEIREQGPFHLTFFTIYNCTFCYELWVILKMVSLQLLFIGIFGNFTLTGEIYGTFKVRIF